ncbi:MAG TPA: hypothetical protein VKA17_03335 [Gammaproteobacteria bacterium]|nr:hypothetical protein [Gammaproteobacteria bacterium]
MTANVCRQCSADTTSIRLDRLAGEDGGVTIVIEGLPALDCANGHKRFPTPDFPLEFLQQLTDTDGLLVATPAVEKGLLKKKAHCPACKQKLPETPEGESRQRAEVAMPDGTPVMVELALPLFRCPGCQQEATLPGSGMERGVMQAVANAFRSAEIPPG